MRKLFFLFIVLSGLFFSMSCAKEEKPGDNSDETVEITEKMFIAQVNDVYLNPDDYAGKVIKLEGLFMQEQSTERTEPYCFVIRYGPGCCGYDGNAGFEVAWPVEGKQPYPKENSWVKATGELRTYRENDYDYLYLDLSSLDVLGTRGAEFVNQ